MKMLRNIFEESAFFKGVGFDLVEILKHLCNYEYAEMVASCMQILNRYFSSHEYLFSRAVHAQVKKKQKISFFVYLIALSL